MEYTPSRVSELLAAVPWEYDKCLRLFWLRHITGSREEIASALELATEEEAVIALVLRTAAFQNANSVLSDAQDLFAANRDVLEAIAAKNPERLTVLVIARDEFRLVQAGSPIQLPDWFPVCAGRETSFIISDLGGTAEISPVNCTESRLQNVAELAFYLEDAIVLQLRQVQMRSADRFLSLMRTLVPNNSLDQASAELELSKYESHIAISLAAPRAYRPTAGDGARFLGAKMLRLTLNSSPKQMAVLATTMALGFNDTGLDKLKQPFFGVLWRPANEMRAATTNWHGILVGYFEAYQLINAGSHASDFPKFPVSLQYAHSLDLRRFLNAASEYVRKLSV